MTTGDLTRRLSAILSADVEGYSRLMREDEEAKAMVQQLLQANPDFALKSWKLARTYKNPEDTERLLSALRKAGLE